MKIVVKHLLPVLIIGTLVVLIFGCRKKVGNEPSVNATADVEAIKKDYYGGNSFKMVSTPINKSLFLIWRPQWDQISIQSDGAKDLYYIPYRPEVVGGGKYGDKNINTNEKRYLVAEYKNGKYDFYYASAINEKSTKGNDQSFSGRMLFQNRKNDNKGFYDFKNGVRQPRESVHIESCLYYNMCTWVGYCNGVQTVVYTRSDGTPTRTITCGIPSFSSCPSANWYSGYTTWDVYCTGDDIPALPAPTTTSNPAPGGGGGSGGNLGDGGGGNYVVDTLVNDSTLHYPCFEWAIETVKAHNTQNLITSTFNMIFGGSGEFTITFGEGNYGTDFDAKAHPVNNYFIDIVFNRDLLVGSSKEYIVASLLHEMVHGIFDARKVMTNDPLKWDETFQHNIMVSQYLDNMSDCLQGIFPNLSWDDAQALSWGGLYETVAWKGLQLAHPVEANNILLRNDAYKKNHPKGERCPP